MEYYTLDASFRRDTVIEGFESFIWTERWQDVGDFQIVIKSTYASRTLLAPGTWIARAGSTYCMQILTVTDETADDGTRDLTITGSSMEAILQDRVAMPALTDTTSVPAWIIIDTPGNICRYAFQQVCVECVLDPGDTIPFYAPGTLLPAGNIPEEDEVITVSAQPGTLFDLIQQLCQTYFLGFRFVRNGDQGEVYFEIYTGNDLTSDQIVKPAVIFDPDLDNLQGITTLTSIAQLKTVAYVYAENGSAVAYGTYDDPDASGTQRRVLLVNSNNTGVAGEDLTAALQSEGTIALTQYRTVYSFDGTLPQNVPYVYGQDYNLGDVIEERNSDGVGNQMYVSEQIFSSDNTGEHSYPTLTVKEIILPGSWVAYDPTVNWDDEASSVTWANITSS